MGYNSPIYDKEKAAKEKSLKQLREELRRFEKAIDEWDSTGYFASPPKMYNEHVGFLKMKIAERIGKKQNDTPRKVC